MLLVLFIYLFFITFRYANNNCKLINKYFRFVNNDLIVGNIFPATINIYLCFTLRGQQTNVRYRLDFYRSITAWKPCSIRAYLSSGSFQMANIINFYTRFMTASLRKQWTWEEDRVWERRVGGGQKKKKYIYLSRERVKRRGDASERDTTVPNYLDINSTAE